MLRSSELPEWLRGLISIDWTDPNYHIREWRKLLKVLGAPNEGPPPSTAGSVLAFPDVQVVSAPKYYLYISDSKADMLYAQSRLGRDARDPDSVCKLEAVLAHLARADRIGTIDQPKEYFAGDIPMRWGPCLFIDPQLTPSPLVYFGGVTEKTVVGLGGSAKHVIGEVGPSRAGVHSCLPSFIFQLRQELGENLPLDLKFTDDNQATLMAIHQATTLAKGPSQKLEFVAKRLTYGPLPPLYFPEKKPDDKDSVLVGTPLYVAMSE